MDDKEKSLLSIFHQKIISKSFDESDIYTLLILLRPYANSKSPVFEFSNFIAHRERDRGVFHKYLLTTKKKLDNLGKENTTIVIKPVFDELEVEISFNKIFNKYGLDNIDSESSRMILLIIISLLQKVRIVNKEGTQFGSLEFAYSQKEISLLGAVILHQGVQAQFPTLSVENHWLPIRQSDQVV